MNTASLLTAICVSALVGGVVLLLLTAIDWLDVDVPRDPADPREQELAKLFKDTTLAHPELTAVAVEVNGAVGTITVSSTLMPWHSERWVYHFLAGGWRLVRIAR